MNILVIEDNLDKLNNIKLFLQQQYNVNRIVYFSSLMESLYFIKNNHEYIDLIILDWCFPMYKGEYPGICMGNEVLFFLKRKNYQIDTIICSSDNVKTNDDNVKKVVIYNPNEYLDFTYNNKGKKKEL